MNTDKRPIDKFSEQALLGAMVRDKSACAKALGVLESNDFYDYRNRKIFATMAEMDRDNESIDIITLMYRLKQKKDKGRKTSWLDDVGESYCYNLDEKVKLENTDKYIEIVQRLSTMRKIGAAGNKAAGFPYVS